MFHFISWKRGLEGHKGHCYFCWKVGLNFLSSAESETSQGCIKSADFLCSSPIFLLLLIPFGKNACIINSSLHCKGRILCLTSEITGKVRWGKIHHGIWELVHSILLMFIYWLIKVMVKANFLFLFNFVRYEQRSHWKWSLSADFSFPTMGWWSEMIWPILRSIC